MDSLKAALRRLDARIRAAVSRAQASGYDPTDHLRGLVITDDEVDRLLEQQPMEPLWPSSTDESPPWLLPRLDAVETDILLIALAPALDRRYERLYAYLQNDVTQKLPTVNLALNLLAGEQHTRLAIWQRLSAASTLRRLRLTHAHPPENQPHAPLLAHQISPAKRVVDFLLGDEAPAHPALRLRYGGKASLPDTAYETFATGDMVYIKRGRGMDAGEAAAALCASLDTALVQANGKRLDRDDWPIALREGLLHGAAVLLDGWQHLQAEHLPDGLWEALVAYPFPVFIAGDAMWEPPTDQREHRLLRLHLPSPTFAERVQLWSDALRPHPTDLTTADLEAVAATFEMPPPAIRRAAQTAADLAASRPDGLISHRDLITASQSHSTANLSHLATRIEPQRTWEDLVLPPEQIEQLNEICMRASHSHIVNERWGFGRHLTQGISALFAGESGTGKTLATEVLAAELGLLLYKIDLSMVVSKYIGETEKNLSALFAEAQSSSAVLFFDEADALFGKRSEVKDAHDRYANVEIAYLLQRVEAYDGIAILATNLRQNLDDAFTRRLDFIVDFPFPEADQRYHIWRSHFPPEAPLAPNLDLSTLADRYELSGGNIRNVVVAAAYLAASEDCPISMTHIQRAVRREHQKMGRLLDI